MVHPRGHPLIQPVGGQSKDASDANARPENASAGGHSGFGGDVNPLCSGYLERLLGRCWDI